MSHSISVCVDALAHRRHVTGPDTIAAIATGSGPAAVSIVRLSGPAAYEIADRLLPDCRPAPSAQAPRSFVYGHLRHPETAEAIDGVIALFFKSPHSYTGEDSVEFQGHGGAVNARRMLDAVCSAGARLAERGEFTRRAVTNGKLDPLQAESVLDLIHAPSDRAARIATAQIEGSLSHSIETVYEKLCVWLADLERYLDIDDSDPGEVERAALRYRLREPMKRICALLRSWYAGRVLHEGARVVLSGAPNSGKSTLFNALLGHERVIVSDRPGTTRDTVEESVLMQGYPIRLVDTAGLRSSDCGIERQGVERSRAAMASAALNLRIIDGERALEPETGMELAGLDRRRTLLVINKSDRPAHASLSTLQPHHPVWCSAMTGQGLTTLKQRILGLLHIDDTAMREVAISTPQRETLRSVLRGLVAARDLLRAPKPDWVLAAHVMQSPIGDLGAMLGREYHEDMLDALFSRFCVGK